MAGIAGTYKGKRKKDLKWMLEKLRHRGEGGKRIFECNDGILGYIVHPNGDFFCDEKGCFVIDGEIYNLEEKNNGGQLMSLYRGKGINFLKEIDGEYAIAIINRGHLLLARDWLGVKPMYYGINNGCIYFASEMKAIQKLVKEVSVLPPGCLFSSKYGLHRYRKMSYVEPALTNLEKIEPLLREKLEKAVQKRLKGKSKVGVFLSGGIDSSIIAYLVKKNFRDVIFLSVGTDKSSDLLFAGSLAKYLRAPHYIHRYDVREMRAVLPKVIYHLESFDALLVRRSIPNFIVARLAKKKGVDTVFIGEGGDELFAGYEWLKNLRGRDLHDKLMDFMPVLHNTGFQRCDRMPLSLGIEAKIPFFDAEFIRFALKISPSLKISDRKQEKWVLRKSFEDFLPSEIVWRKKQKFSQGAGSYEIMARVADKEISDAEFRREKLIEDGSILKNKEELLYYRIFRKFFPYDSILPNVGRSI